MADALGQTTGRRLLIALAGQDDRLNVADLTIGLGLRVVAEADNGQIALDQARRLRPDLVVAGIDLPGLDGLALTGALAAEGIVTILLLPALTGPDLIDRAIAAGALGFLIRPASALDLHAASALAFARRDETQRLQADLARQREVLDDRVIIEGAKGLIMGLRRYTEPEAHQFLQQLSMNLRRKMRVVAEAMIRSFEAGQNRRR